MARYKPHPIRSDPDIVGTLKRILAENGGYCSLSDAAAQVRSSERLLRDILHERNLKWSEITGVDHRKYSALEHSRVAAKKREIARKNNCTFAEFIEGLYRRGATLAEASALTTIKPRNLYRISSDLGFPLTVKGCPEKYAEGRYQRRLKSNPRAKKIARPVRPPKPIKEREVDTEKPDECDQLDVLADIAAQKERIRQQRLRA